MKLIFQTPFPRHFPALLCAFLGLALGMPAQAHQISDYGRKIIASVLVLEAADQGIEGMQAVLNVIDNRARGNPAAALRQVARRKAFTSLNSITAATHPDYSPALRRAMRDRMWTRAKDIVDAYSRGGYLPDITAGATHYCIHPPASWRNQMAFTVRIGEHQFFRE